MLTCTLSLSFLFPAGSHTCRSLIWYRISQSRLFRHVNFNNVSLWVHISFFALCAEVMSGQSLSLRGPFRPNDAFSRSYQSSDESESGSPGAGGPSSPRFQRDFGAQFRPTRHDTSTFSLYDEDPPYIPPGGPFASGIGYPGQRHTELVSL